MSIIEEKYQALTNINIEEQKQLWNERGKGYYGEYLVFRELFLEQNVSGVSKILMNVRIPTPNGKSTELDLLLIHETGLYVFEIKHYKGTIYGKIDDRNWTQYFRTEANQSFKNPIAQNQYHIDAIRKMYPQMPIHSFVVFTNVECNLRVECSTKGISVCLLRELAYELRMIILSKSAIMDMEQTNAVFEKLMIYSPMMKENVVVAEQEVPFYEYIHRIIENQKMALQQNSENFEKQIEANNKSIKKMKTSAAIVCVLSVVACLIVSSMVWALAGVRVKQEQVACEEKVKEIQEACDEEVKQAKAELEEFSNKFERVEEFKNGDITLSDEIIEVTDIVLENSKDVVDAVKFSCVLNWKGEEYGIRLMKNTKYIVILEDGSVQEYDLFGVHFRYNTTERIGKGHYITFELPVCEFYGMDADDIAYIKLVDVAVWKAGVNFGQNLFEGYELEVYCK